MSIKVLSKRDRIQIAAFHAFFNCSMGIHQKGPEKSFADAVVKSSDDVFAKLSNDNIQRWFTYKGKGQ